VKFLVVVERGEKSWGAYVPDLPGCVAVGESRDEVVRLAKEAIDLHVADLKDRGESVPQPTSEGELVDAASV
jgi:predicted RNase H-like HicB family nuclease